MAQPSGAPDSESEARPWASQRRALVSALLFLLVVVVAALIIVSQLPPRPRPWPRLLLGLAAVVACASCLWRARASTVDRAAWTCFGLACASYACGTAYNAVVLRPADADPIPSLADIGWLSFYPFAYAGTALLARRVPGSRRRMWLDGLAVACGLAALTAAFIVPPVLDDTGDGSVLRVALAIAFPFGDLVLVAIVLATLIRTGFGVTPLWLLLGAAFAVLTIADVPYASSAARGEFDSGGLSVAGFPVAFAVLATSAWLSPRRPTVSGTLSPRALVLPGLAGASGVAVIAADHFNDVNLEAFVLAIVSVLVAVVRLAVFQSDLHPLRESVAFQRGFDAAGVGMAQVSLDGRWLRVNPALAALLGTPAPELVGRPYGGAPLPSRPPPQGTALPAYEQQFTRPDGRVVETLITPTVVADVEEAPHYSLHVSDITETARAGRTQHALVAIGGEALAATDAVALFGAVIGIIGAAVRAVTAAIVEIEGETRAVAADAVDPHDVEALVAAIAHPSADGGPLTRAIGREDSARYLLCFTRDHGTSYDNADRRFATAVASILATAVERIDAEERMRRSALYDHLTGLANRALASAHLEQAIAHAARAGSLVAVLLLDLDDFKSVNDTLGHATGDALLQAMAPRLREVVRAEDLVARLGGDEFLIICSEIHGEAELLALAERLQAALGRPVLVDDNELTPLTSIGIAISDGAGATPSSLLRDADLAMYHAKERGGHGFEVFDEVLRSSLVERVSTERALRQALDRNEFELVYQPIVDIGTGRLARLEALLRWRRPGHGTVGPDSFLAAAQRSDVIRPIGSWVLGAACRQLRVWNAELPESAPVSVAINLSARQIGDALVEEVQQVLAETGVHPDQLEAELTEHLLMDVASAPSVLDRLRALGLRITLDDFGSGYSSLGQLRSLRLDTIKLDRSFIASLDDARRPTAPILRAVTEMAAALDLDVVAEGVETPEQLRLVRSAGCRLVQGFYLAEPMPADECTELLRRGHTWADVVID